MNKGPTGKKRPKPKKQPLGIGEAAVPYSPPSKPVSPALRYTRFEINHFRGFEYLEMGPFSRVNLITGINGVGKTAVLEGLFLHIGVLNPQLALRVNLWRGLGVVGERMGLLWKTLFWQFRTGEPIVLAGTDSDGKRRLLSINTIPSLPTVEKDATGGASLDVSKGIDNDLLLEYKDEKGRVSKARGIPELITRGDQVRLQLRTDPPVATTGSPGVFLNSWRQGVSEEEVQRFSELRIRNQDHLVLEVLKHLDPRLEGLEILSPHGAGMIYGHLKGFDEPVPLTLLGDGVRRVASLVLAMGYARDGTLLVDEIENGIHHSVLGHLWTAIGYAAELFNTQVVATTHSLECIIAAYQAFRARTPFELALHRLDRADGETRAITYDEESMEGALSIPLEVR